MKVYYVQVYCYDQKSREFQWKRLRPTEGEPYKHETRDEASKTMRLCYPDPKDHCDVRIEESEE